MGRHLAKAPDPFFIGSRTAAGQRLSPPPSLRPLLLGADEVRGTGAPSRLSRKATKSRTPPGNRYRTGRDWAGQPAVRAPVEHGFAHLKNWRVLGKVRTDPRWATALVRALLVLTNREVAR